MPGEATIGALRVVLGADTAKFEDNLKSAADSLSAFGKKITTIAAGVGLERVFEKAFDAVVESIMHAVEAADQLAKASQKFGIPVETLSALSNAAALSDVSLQDLGSSLSRLSKSMVAAEGPTSSQAVAFQALGVSVKDANGNLKNADDILLAVADSFSKFRDGTTKTALAVAIFGRAGADMIPFLDQGASGINKLTGEMKDLGLVVDGETAKAAEKFNDDLKLLGQAKDAIILKILGSSGMLQAMNLLAAQMVATAGETAKLSDVGNQLGNVLRVLPALVDVLTAAFVTVTAPTKAFATALYDIATGDFAGALAALSGNWDAVTASIGKAADSIKTLTAATSDGAKQFQSMTNLGQEAAKALADAPKFDPDAAKKLKQFNDELQKMRDRALDISGAFAGQLAPGFLAATANMEALKGQITIVGDTLVKLGPQAQAFNQAMQQVAGQQLIASTLDPWQQFEIQIKNNTAALTALGLTSQQIADINEKAAQRAGVGWQNATQDILTNAANGFAAFAQKNKEFAGIAKGLAIAEAIFNTYLAATKALAAYPPPFGEIAAAASVVAGLGMVAKISAQQFATGGSFKVPGGISGVDSHVMPLALSPGERVDVTPSSAVRDNRGGGREIILNGIGPRDLFTGTMLRDLVDALNQGQRDGYRLKVAEG